jgi:predicted DsbA family dithiol-disulfide isomerase
MAEEAGLPLHPNRIRVNSHRALEAAEYARDNGQFAPFHRRLFAASFAEGLNIGDVDVLTQLGEEAGLDPEALRRAVEERRYASRLADVTRQAHALGINGTPTFVIGPYGVVGAQPYAALKYTVDVALGRVAPPVRRT